MRGYPVPLSCRCHACRLTQVRELLVSGRVDAARLALEEAARVMPPPAQQAAAEVAAG